MTFDKKIFGIGLQKTGLTSLLRVMQRSGLKAQGTSLPRRRQFCIKRDYKGILDYYDTVDFSCDWPTPLMYKAAYGKYRDKARFILTVRKDADTWFESVKRHNWYAHPVLHRHRWFFGRFYPHGFDDEHKEYYERHTREVEAFFAEHGASHQLLKIRIDQPQSIAKLAEFLELEIPFSEFPRENVSKGDRRDIGSIFKWHYNRTVQPIYGRVAPRLSKKAARQARPIDMDYGV
ncbi:MAG: hypothetical protein KDJ47_04580 [Hyphomicrobiaceae bacterium]|nr:hypothetical protein [Hyphomicrobiaceae bacterium]